MNSKQIIRIVAFILFAAFLYWAHDLLFPIVIAIILYYLLNPLVCLMSDKRPKGLGINRILAITVSFVVFLAVAVAFFKFIIPPFYQEFSRLANNLPEYFNSGQNFLASIKDWYADFQVPHRINAILLEGIQNFMNYMVNFVQQTAAALVGIFSQFFKLISIPIITFFMLKDKEKILDGFINFLPKDHRAKTLKILTQINTVMHNYIRAQLILCVIVGTAMGVGLYFMGVKYFLILGLIAAITEAIPFLGPFLGAIPALAVSILISPALALEVAALYIGIQTLENAVLVPKIMGDRLNLHPLTVICALLILGKLLGGWGLFFAAPITAILKIIYQELSSA